jgi:hypothetical protein
MKQPATPARLSHPAVLLTAAAAVGSANAGSKGNENFLQLQQHLSPDTADILVIRDCDQAVIRL